MADCRAVKAQLQGAVNAWERRAGELERILADLPRLSGEVIRRFKRKDGVWIVCFNCPTGPTIYRSDRRHPDSTRSGEEESAIVAENARKSIAWAVNEARKLLEEKGSEPTAKPSPAPKPGS